MSNIRDIFPKVFVYGLVYTMPLLLLELVIFSLATRGVIFQHLFNVCIVTTFMSAPIALVLAMVVPEFSAPVQNFVVINPKYPVWIAWIGRQVNRIENLVYRIKSGLFSAYYIGKEPFARWWYAVMHVAMLVIGTISASKRFDHEAFTAILVGGGTLFIIMLIPAFLYHRAMKKTKHLA